MLDINDSPEWLMDIINEAVTDVWHRGIEIQRDTVQECANLRIALLYHSWLYYVLDDPVVPDAVYDRLFRELEAIESEYQCLESPLSPTQRVGAPRPPEGA